MSHNSLTIIDYLKMGPQPGPILADRLDCDVRNIRRIIAELRKEGNSIIVTPQGYVLVDSISVNSIASVLEYAGKLRSHGLRELKTAGEIMTALQRIDQGRLE